MFRTLAIALLSLVASTAVFAAEYEPDSRVDAVTVFPSGAQVTRVASADLEAGEHTVIVDDLPAFIDPASVRVRGLSDGEVAIGGVDIRSAVLSVGITDIERSELEDALAELNDTNAALLQQLEDINARRDIVQALVRNGSSRGDEGGISANTISDVLAIIADQLDQLNTEMVATRKERRVVDAEIETVKQKLALLAPREEQRTVVEIAVSSTSQASAAFEIEYAVREAGWRAVYDAALELNGSYDNAALALTRRAMVYQQTSEEWDDISLMLSTARPTSATDAPRLGSNVIDNRPAAEPKSVLSSRVARQSEDMAMMESAVASPAPMVEKAAAMDTGGFNTEYLISGRVDISNASEDKSVLIGSVELAPEVSAVSVPRIDPTAYLIADFELSGEAILLPGEVLLTRDGTFIGRGSMPLLAPGETYQLGFGSDDLVKVERIEKTRKKGETGILVSSNTELREAVVNVTNNHDFQVLIRIVDRMPVSDHEDIAIEPLASSSSPSETNLDGRRGVNAYDLRVDAGAGMSVNIGYEVSWPEEMQVTRID
ncbi:MAG: mucoidy inhibitor MuiA family protein [Pseudomonadota bacterium]